MDRRQVTVAGALAAILPGLARAQTFPSKPIRIVVPFGAGGIADLTARVVAQKLGESLGQSVIVDNKPGAGGIAAGEFVARAEPDGHTLLLMSNGTAVSTGLFKSLPFDAQKDFAPVVTLGFFDLAILSAVNGRFKTLKDLLQYAKANPGKLNVGTINVGSTQHLTAELLKFSAEVDFQVVPFNGSPAVLTALRGGQIDVAVEILGPVMGQISAKTIRPLAVMAFKRARGLPDVPTVRESGVTGFNVSSWNALAAPAQTPASVITILNREIDKLLSNPVVRKQLAELNVTTAGGTPDQLRYLLSSETKRWSEVIARANVPRQ